MPEVRFCVPGDPKGKGRPRTAVRGRFATIYTDKQTRNYEALVRLAAEKAMNGAPPFDEPVAMTIRIRIAPPASASKKAKAAMLAGTLWPAKKPDLSNIGKAVEDGANTVVYRDDSLIVGLIAWKTYSDTPGVDVQVKTL